MSEGVKASPIELFFDLVFVFAITQVTAFMADHDNLNAHGMLRGLLLMAVLWWCWCGYAWLGNTVRADEGIVRLALFAVMTAMFIVALTIPEAFNDLPGGLPGPLVFASCYLIVRVVHLVVYRAAAADDPGLRAQLVKSAVPMLAGALLLFVAAFTSGPVQTALWALALAVDYGGVLALSAGGWRVHSAAHFAERHGLMVIIALGESIVAIGVGVADKPISWPIIVGSVFGVAIAASLWWLYFDVVALVAERVLSQARGAKRAALARDSYTYLHLPMVAGIVLLALGMKKVLTYASEPETLTKALHGIPLFALYGGVVLYLLAHLGFRYRNIGSVNKARVVAVVLLLALVPVADLLPGLAALGLLCAVCVGLTVYEVIHNAEARRAVRDAEHEHAAE